MTEIGALATQVLLKGSREMLLVEGFQIPSTLSLVPGLMSKWLSLARCESSLLYGYTELLAVSTLSALIQSHADRLGSLNEPVRKRKRTLAKMVDPVEACILNFQRKAMLHLVIPYFT